MLTENIISLEIARLIAKEIAIDKSARGRTFRAATPIVVRQHGGADQYWRVPLIDNSDNNLAGFLDVRQDLSHPNRCVLTRYNLMPPPSQNHPLVQEGDVSCLTPDEVVREARDLVGLNSTVQEPPALVYLGFETRLAWKVRMARADGSVVEVFVTPGSAFLQP